MTKQIKEAVELVNKLDNVTSSPIKTVEPKIKQAEFTRLESEADYYLFKQNYDQASAIYKKIILDVGVKSPNAINSYLGLIKCYQKNEQYNEAYLLLKHAIPVVVKASDEFSTKLLEESMADILVKLNKYERAESLLFQLISKYQMSSVERDIECVKEFFINGAL